MNFMIEDHDVLWYITYRRTTFFINKYKQLKNTGCQLTPGVGITVFCDIFNK